MTTSFIPLSVKLSYVNTVVPVHEQVQQKQPFYYHKKVRGWEGVLICYLGRRGWMPYSGEGAYQSEGACQRVGAYSRKYTLFL